MLSVIKDMINQKQEYLEAANIILEDTTGNNLDDLIVLGEDGDEGFPDDESYDTGMDFEEEPDFEDEEEDPEQQEDEPASLMDEPIDDEEGDDSKPGDSSTSGGILDEPVDDSENFSMDSTPAPTPQPLPAEPAPVPQSPTSIADEPLPLPGDDLPTPVGMQTGQAIDPDDDMLSINVDLRSNTASDILPVPPRNAIEAMPLEDDTSQHVDSGFGGDPAPSTTSDPVLESMMNFLNKYRPLSEGITLGGDDNGGDDINVPDDDAAQGGSDQQPDDGAAAEPAPDQSQSEEPPAEEENDVTSAVRDKVAEADAGTDESTGDATEKSTALMKQLTAVSKSVDDLKQKVMLAVTNANNSGIEV